MTHPCRFPFLDCPGCDRCAVQSYTARAKAISAKAKAERRKITGRGIALGVVAFLSIFALLVAAHSGLSRAERAYQSAQRV
jgi:hypothetical protein